MQIHVCRPCRGGSIRRLTRSRSITPHVDDVLDAPPQHQRPSANAAPEAGTAAEADAEAERAAFLAATEGFAVEGTIVVVPVLVLKPCTLQLSSRRALQASRTLF